MCTYVIDASAHYDITNGLTLGATVTGTHARRHTHTHTDSGMLIMLIRVQREMGSAVLGRSRVMITCDETALIELWCNSSHLDSEKQ